MASLKKALHELKDKVHPDHHNDGGSISSKQQKPGDLQHSNASEQTRLSMDSSIHTQRADTITSRTSIDTSQQAASTHSSIKSPRSPRARSPVRFMREKLHIRDNSSSPSSHADTNTGTNGDKVSKNQQRKANKQMNQERRRHEQDERANEIIRRKNELEEQARANETPEQRARYGYLPVNSYARPREHEERADIGKLAATSIGSVVYFRARIHHIRRLSSKLVFLVFRQQTHTVQGVLQHNSEIPPYMVIWAEHLSPESIVMVRGLVQEPLAKQGEIIGASVHDVEIAVQSMHVESKLASHLPFTVNEAEITKKEAEDVNNTRHRVNDRARLQNRVIDLRTSPAQAIFRIQSAVCNLFRSHLDSKGFVEIHTPKLQGGATESGASVFKVDYFGRQAFLAQSPQLAKQMMISADFGRVYEIGAVFRAENSNTHRHLTEYTGLDLEMTIDEHYHEVLTTLDETFKAIFTGIYGKYRHELEVVKRHFPHEDLVWLEKTPIIPFAEAIKMLNDSGWTDDDGKPLPLNEDLGTRDEIQLGRVIKEKLGTDYYVLDKFPSSARPFYAMEDPEDPNITNAFDIFLRGQEILSGGQRIHDSNALLERMGRLKVDHDTMQEYMDAFNWGAPPHGGGGIGLERIVMLLLSLGDIRHASLLPRDPKSLPEKPVVKKLRHPEASTTDPPWMSAQDHATGPHMELQPLEKLIANYGDATNTSWLEPRTHIWRDTHTGAAVGYVPIDSYAITMGNPLCHQSQYMHIMAEYLGFIRREKHLKPLWLLVGHEVEEVLASRFNWRSLSVAAEQRLDPASNPAKHDSDLQRKVRHAQKEGVKIVDIPLGEPVPEDVRTTIDKRVEDWLAHRQGKQVHMTEIRPWQDMEHRTYHYAVDKDGAISALVVLCQLAPEHGWQVKYSLDLPGAPSGTIEYLVMHCLEYLAGQGCHAITFGGGASSQLTPGHNLKGARIKVLSRMYKTIATELKLTNKSEFREKLGAEQDPVYVCYPPHGLGPGGIKAIMNFFENWDD